MVGLSRVGFGFGYGLGGFAVSAGLSASPRAVQLFMPFAGCLRLEVFSFVLMEMTNFTVLSREFLLPVGLDLQTTSYARPNHAYHASFYCTVPNVFHHLCGERFVAG